MSTPGFQLFDGLGDALQDVLDLRRMQHGLTAANLANADTPGYHAREIPFSEILGGIVDGAERGESLPEAETEVREIDPLPWALDDNSVSPEREAVKLSENTLMYDALSAGMSKRLALLRFAASDGRS
jgi:flagellar basal-body rod protein FlgB